MFEGFKVLFVEDDPPVRASLVQTLELSGLEVQAFGTAEQLLPQLSAGLPAIVITDVRLPGMDGLTLLERIKTIDPEMPVVVVTAHGDVSMAVRAMRAGAYDFIEKPFSPERFVETATRALERRMMRVALDELREQLAERSGIESVLLGQSAAMQEVKRMILRLAATSADVMIHGETGTGKEVVARCLHDHSPRRDRHFVAINCGGLPDTLLDSELFGHEAGAFTSAAKRRIGRIEHANGGTLLLDEIESMPMPMQIKLLRILQERRLARLGSNEELPVNLRVVAATKYDLLTLSEQGRFRADLYYRLNVAVLRLPPLRERREDIPLLFTHFVRAAAERYGMPPPEPSAERLRELMAHDWPGNVREVRNAADRFVLEGEASPLPGADERTPVVPLAQQMERVEKALIEQALRRCQGRMQDVMQQLGTPKKTLYDKLHRHGIDPERFR
ncbi:sigma-54-dependent Fis family transcriptional regulator [Ideonella sp. 4Y16]|uniref:Sigma-54-dependent Fis family transcriptional regulator n=1 Tax=Ideonella alba TaxID=2824118 RepID=A0A940YCW9_9BURK|nr:sigma-54 dependent transcriptional regulator [Ideonella alba]MBQ0933268.1 sigma-54-dependent Fis family transcriptional regulator [Ideonella alba]MBQ0944738.1 sigma-54-dependent Fis family transcriptional regulator [Ideonella alba]